MAWGVQNSQKFRVRTGMKVLQKLQRFRVLRHGRTELTEVPGMGNGIRVNAHRLGGSRVRVDEVEELIQLAWHVFTGPINVHEAICRT